MLCVWPKEARLQKNAEAEDVCFSQLGVKSLCRVSISKWEVMTRVPASNGIEQQTLIYVKSQSPIAVVIWLNESNGNGEGFSKVIWKVRAVAEVTTARNGIEKSRWTGLTVFAVID